MGKIRKKWRELGRLEGTKENIPRMEDWTGDVGNAKMPSGLWSEIGVMSP